MTSAAQEIAPRKPRIVVTAAAVVLFWLAAVLLVTAAGSLLAQEAPWMSVAAKTAAIVGAALAYMKFAAPRATLDHALGVGALWLFFGVVVEVVTSARSGHAWYQLLGAPDSALRNVLLVAWVIAPALFARHKS